MMTRPARLVVVDQPTVLLSYSYQQKLLSLIQTWQQEGKSIIFCSNNLDHLFADRIDLANRVKGLGYEVSVNIGLLCCARVAG